MPAPYIRTKRPLTGIADEDSFTIVIENIPVVSTNELFRAFELYFSAVFVFNVEYNQDVRKTSIFMQNFFLSIKDKNVSKTMRNLYATLIKTHVTEGQTKD